jgi:hypothetical protein
VTMLDQDQIQQERIFKVDLKQETLSSNMRKRLD